MNQEILTKRVLFCGYYGMNNVGDDCFGSVLTWGARSYWGTELPLLLSNQELSGPVRTRAACSGRRLFRGQIILESYWQLLRASCVVWGGGSIFHSQAPTWTPKHLSFVAARLGITPAGAIGVSLGPYRSAQDEKGVRDYLGRLQFLTVRDEASYQNACAMGLPYRPVLAADLALLLPRMLPEVAGPDPGDPILGITICHYERYRGQSLENEARRERVLLEALRHLVARGFAGTFRFFVFNGHRVNGDQGVTAELAAQLEESGARVEVIPYAPDPIAVWSQVAQCRAMVSTRLHGAIYAAAAAVPCCLIEYHRKCGDFMADAGVDPGWRIGDADCSARELGEKLIGLLSAAPESFYPNRERLIAMAERNFTFAS